jgi:hypothetical protein
MKAHHKEIVLTLISGVATVFASTFMVALTYYSVYLVGRLDDDRLAGVAWAIGTIVAAFFGWTIVFFINDVKMTVRAIRSDYARRNHPSIRR